jgi:probable HAF family extracellular repeat protein
MTRLVLPATALAVALMVPHDPIAAAKPGNVVELGTLGGGFSDASGINNDPGSVQIVGRSTRADGFTHGFFWTAPGPPMVDLGTFGGGNSFAEDINDHGLIAGTSQDAARQQWAAVWRRSGGAWTIENLGTVTGTCCAHANGIGGHHERQPKSRRPCLRTACSRPAARAP